MEKKKGNKMIALKIDADRVLHKVSPDLIGIFFEDINFGADGGLNANMVSNYSFDGVYMGKDHQEVTDPFRYWTITGGQAESLDDDALGKHSRYARVRTTEKVRLENKGYNGGKEYATQCAIAIKKGHAYTFEAYMRGELNGSVFVAEEDGTPLTDAAGFAAADGMPADGKAACDAASGDAPAGTAPAGDAPAGTASTWVYIKKTLHGQKAAYGKLVIEFTGNGAIDLDCVQLYDADFWGKDDPKWQNGKLRKDLVQALADLKPKFMRFPGGCIVEGAKSQNEYNWKETVGPLYDRKPTYNLWAEEMPDGGCGQSYQVGFYEFFCLCEDIGAAPQPTLFAGINCQFRSEEIVDIDSEEFDTYVTQNYLDLIEFANGDPAASEWAALRADMGHPAPFGLSRIGIGNENHGEDYIRKFDKIRKAIHEKYPEILCIMSAGFQPYKEHTQPFWDYAKTLDHEILLDEHCYHSPAWFYESAYRFDKYDRNVGKAKLYFGEYAANNLSAPEGKVDAQHANSFGSALSEAAFLTGAERNGDFLLSVSYAPLFNLIGGTHWTHNMIDFNPGHVCLTANYLVQKLFGNFQAENYIGFEGGLPENVYCSVEADDEKIIIKLVNANAEEIAVDFGLPESSAGAATATAGATTATANVFRLHHEDLNARNRLDFTGEADYAVQIRECEADLRNYRCPGQTLDVLIVKR